MVTDAPPPTLGELERGLAAYLERFEAGQLSAGDATVVGKRFGRIKRMAQAAEALCLARAAATSSVRRRGDADGSKWAGRQMGVPGGQAADLLKLAGRLDKAPRTKEALLGGGISAEIAAEVARTAEVAPEAENDMLVMAGQESLSELKKRGRRVRAAAAGADQRAARVQRERHLRTWIDDEDGSGRGSWKLPAADQAQLLATLEPLRERFFGEARRQGRHEPLEAYAADALVQLAADAAAARQNGVVGAPGLAGGAGSPAVVGPTAVAGTPALAGERSGDGASASVEPVRGGSAACVDGDERSARSDSDSRSDSEPPQGQEREPLQGPEVSAGGSAARGRSRATAMAEVVVRVDHGALARGRPTVGEVCEVIGTGPVPAADVRRWMAGGAFVAVVVTPADDPLDVRRVAHLGRRPPALMAVWGDGEPEASDGTRVIGCAVDAEPRLPLPGVDGDADVSNRRAPPLAGASAQPPAAQSPSGETSPEGFHSSPAEMFPERFRHVRVVLHVTEDDLGDAELTGLRAEVDARGVDVATLVHRGRRPNAVQRSALLWRSPECAVLGCANQARLEADHVIEWRITEHTTLDELEHLCRSHHRMKTHDGYRLAPGRGKRALLPPEGSSAQPQPCLITSGPVAWRAPRTDVLTRRCRGSARQCGSAQPAGP